MTISETWYNDSETQRRAVLQGAGIGLLANFFVAPQLRANRLVLLNLDYVSRPVEFYLYLPGGRDVPRRTRVLADYVYEKLRAHKDLRV